MWRHRTLQREPKGMHLASRVLWAPVTWCLGSLPSMKSEGPPLCLPELPQGRGEPPPTHNLT